MGKRRRWYVGSVVLIIVLLFGGVLPATAQTEEPKLPTTLKSSKVLPTRYGRKHPEARQAVPFRSWYTSTSRRWRWSASSGRTTTPRLCPGDHGAPGRARAPGRGAGRPGRRPVRPGVDRAWASSLTPQAHRSCAPYEHVVGVRGVGNYELDLTETVPWIGATAVQALGVHRHARLDRQRHRRRGHRLRHRLHARQVRRPGHGRGVRSAYCGDARPPQPDQSGLQRAHAARRPGALWAGQQGSRRLRLGW